MAFPLGWPPRAASSRRSIRFYADGTSTANYYDNAWLFHQVNKSYAMIGGYTVNDMVLISSQVATGPLANNFIVEVVVPTTGPSALSATLSGVVLTVSLATIASGELDIAANTATLVAAVVAALPQFDAIANGTGAASLFLPQRIQFFGAGGMMTPTPYIERGQATVPVEVGHYLAGGSPGGGGMNDVDPITKRYERTEAMAFANTIVVANDNATATNTLLVSFDGINNHATVRGGELITFRNRFEAGLCVKAGVGTPAFRIMAW